MKWYKRDPEAALTGMMCLSLEERGAYNTVLDLIYAHGGSILDDDRFLAGWMRCDVRIWKRIRAKLIEVGKLYLEDGYLRNKAADVAVHDAVLRAASSQHAGLTSASKSRGESSKVNDLPDAPVERNPQPIRIRDKNIPPNPHSLPEWVDPSAWKDFLEMRKRNRKPMTQKAEELAIKRLGEIRQRGHDPTAVIEQSVRNSWLDFYDLKPASGGFARGHPAEKPKPVKSNVTTL
jgi:uncharacterized protein YdaU (DUF1376 family)